MRRYVVAPGFAVLLMSSSAIAQNETVVVYGTGASDIGVARDRIPGTVQAFDANDLSRGHSGSILSALGSQASGVSLNDVQGNELFQDVRYRGFAASPLQGTAQGIAVYQNGVRLNEAFGDTVNWDMIPENAISGLDIWSSNPVFGLNALGGAVNLTMKDGFNFRGGDVSAQGGSFRQGQVSAEYGMKDGDASLYVAADGLSDGGWRPHSQSALVRLYADGGYRFGGSEIHIVASGAVSSLGVIGPTPVELLARGGDAAIYTWPQITQNQMGSIAVNGKTTLADHWQLSGNFYMRSLRQRHVDGNDGDFERCSSSSSFRPYLCLQDDAFPRPTPFTGSVALNFRNQFVLLDPNGNPAVPFTAGVTYGTLDRTGIGAAGLGGTLQVSSDDTLFGLQNYFTVGGSFDHGSIGFLSTNAIAQLNSDLSITTPSTLPGAGTIVHTAGQTGFAPTNLRARNSYYGLYAVEALSITPQLTVTAGVRINMAKIDSNDRSGVAPELNGSHSYSRANPVAGATYDTGLGVTLYGGYSQSSRAPTPLELDCADPTRPCLLENSLTADPPLKQVSAGTYEAGVRIPGMALGSGSLSGDVGYFHTDISNDIVPLASPAVLGHGYYANVPATAREGVDTSLRFAMGNWSIFVNYSYLQATYQFSGTLASSNNPFADASGNIAVTPGRNIPLSPAHAVRFGGDATILEGLSLGFDASFTGSQYFDGDQSNQNPKLRAFWQVNLHTSYQLTENLQVYGLVNNLFDSHDATYGSFFGPDGVSGVIAPALIDPRTLTLMRPRSFILGVKAKF